MRIDFNGLPTQVGAAFATRLHAYEMNGEQRIAPASAPQIPTALAAIVQSVRGLATVDEHPLYHPGASRFVGHPSPKETSFFRR
jgi:hypothetical protein